MSNRNIPLSSNSIGNNTTGRPNNTSSSNFEDDNHKTRLDLISKRLAGQEELNFESLDEVSDAESDGLKTLKRNILQN